MKVRRLAGTLLLVGAGIGIILSLIGLVAVWTSAPRLTASIEANLTLIDDGLTSTEAVLTTVDQMVQITSLDVSSLDTTTKALSQGIHDANPMFDSLIQLTGKDLPGAISSTQASLTSAQSSALLIDNTLSALSTLPVFPLPPYHPAVPLHTALQNVSTSLDSLKPSLTRINDSLATGKTDMNAVDAEITKISENTQEISGSLTSAQTVIQDYKTSVSQLKLNVEETRSNTPKWILGGSWIATLIFAWLIFSQVGLGLHGYDMIQRANESTEISVITQE